MTASCISRTSAAKNDVYSTFTPKRESLINVRKIHRQERARPRFDLAQHQLGIG